LKRIEKTSYGFKFGRIMVLVIM